MSIIPIIINQCQTGGIVPNEATIRNHDLDGSILIFIVCVIIGFSLIIALLSYNNNSDKNYEK